MLGELFRSSDRLKLNAAVLVELTEELDILKSRGMHEGSKHVDGKIEQMSDDENENKDDYSEHRRPIVPSIFTTCAIIPAASPSASIRE